MHPYELRLRSAGGPGNGTRDLFGIAPTFLIIVWLVRWWQHTQGDDPVIANEQQLAYVAGPLAGAVMLMALAMLISLRNGIIDLSVWMAASAGAMLSGVLIARGVPTGGALVAAAGMGVIIGGGQGLLALRTRWPALLITAATAGIIYVALRLLSPPHDIVLNPSAFHGWLITLQVEIEGVPDVTIAHQQPLRLSMVLLALSIYAIGVLAILGALTPPAESDGWKRRLAAQMGSGAIASLAGYCSLMEHGRAVAPRLPIGDITVAAAVALSGGIFLMGNYRSRMAGLLLPPATLAATLWVQRFARFGKWGIEWQVVFLLVAVAGYHSWLRWYYRHKTDKIPQPEVAGPQQDA